MQKGLSRAVKAFCWQCYEGRDDCLAGSCPLYEFRPGNDAEACRRWWDYPRRQWHEASQAAGLRQPMPERQEPTDEQRARALANLQRSGQTSQLSRPGAPVDDSL